MLLRTTDALRAVLRLDPTLEVPGRARIVNAMLRADKILSDPPSPQPVPRLLRRDEVARRLSVTTRGVDLIAKQGLLQKVILPGRSRGIGFRESEVTELINSLPLHETKSGAAGLAERERHKTLRKLCVELIEHYRGIEGLEIKGPMVDTIIKIGEIVGEPMA